MWICIGSIVDFHFVSTRRLDGLCSSFFFCGSSVPKRFMVKLYVVQHKFEAVEAVELSVEKGEVLQSSGDSGRDGWRLVMRKNGQEGEKGFVPESYLSELAEESLTTPLIVDSAIEPETTSSAKPSVPSPDSHSVPSANELEFEKLLRQRKDSTKYIRDRLNDAILGIQKAQVCTGEVFTSLQALEESSSSSHASWQRLIEEEKQKLSSGSA